MSQQRSETIRRSLEESLQVKKAFLERTDEVERAADLWVETLLGGGRIYFIGNGGSAADAQHLATELVGRFERDNGFAAQALTTDTSLMSALGNDFSFDEVYSRQVRALGRQGDLLVAISTSGNSANVVKAVEQAKLQGMKCLGMSGRDGGRLATLCDQCLVVPSDRTCRIQEVHITLGHILCELTESAVHQAQGASCA